jgi:serine/threonine protein phosphatase PrpC
MSLIQRAGQTDIGRNRQDNQDTFIDSALWSAHRALLVVIDGVGGYAGGAQAAALAKEAIHQYMATQNGDTLTMLCEAVVHANNQIVRQREQNPALARMCCVLTAAIADAQTRTVQYVHVGDTRLYRFRQQQLEKLTHDHSLVGVREDANQLTELEAMHHPRRNEILRDVGSVLHRVDDADFLESGETDFAPGDTLLLCSDGLTDMLTRQQLVDILSQATPVEEQVTELIHRANEQGGQDNITVVLARYPIHSDGVSPNMLAGSIPVETPLPVSIPVAKPSAGSGRARKWVYGIVFLLLLMMLTGIIWQFGSPKPVNDPETLSADSTADTYLTNQPDSTKKP